MKNTLLLTVCLFGIGCFSSSEPQVQPKMPFHIYICDDVSLSRDGADKVDKSFVNSLATNLQQYSGGGLLSIAHFSQKHPDPIVCQLRPATEVSAYDPNYIVKTRKREYEDSLNINSVQTLFVGFENTFSESQVNDKANFSYINRHLRGLSHSLKDTTIDALRLAFIATDFVDHEPSGKASHVDSTVISSLNSALEMNPNSHLYVITDVEIIGTELEKLKATYIGSWSEALNIITIKLKKYE